ncbi:MAG: IMP dehydrogenase [Bacteroidales bacterium]|nr:IMP dehydrogenase [Bacteroidales bacterium]
MLCGVQEHQGILGRVSYKGYIEETIYQLIGGLRSGMGYCGAKDLAELKKAKFTRVTASGMAESHPHDVTITKETPDYTRGE